jgi:hypothetical protein
VAFLADISQSIISILYTVLYLLTTLQSNHPGEFLRKIRALCFKIACLAMIFWGVTTIASCVVISKPSLCLKGNRDCNLQIAAIVESGLAV